MDMDNFLMMNWKSLSTFPPEVQIMKWNNSKLFCKTALQFAMQNSKLFETTGSDGIQKWEKWEWAEGASFCTFLTFSHSRTHTNTLRDSRDHMNSQKYKLCLSAFFSSNPAQSSVFFLFWLLSVSVLPFLFLLWDVTKLPHNLSTSNDKLIVGGERVRVVWWRKNEVGVNFWQ